MAPTVAELLEKQGIEVGEHDVVVPAPDTRLAEGTAIAVNYGRLVTITVDGAQQQLWTTATSVDRALDELDIDTTGADIDPAWPPRSAATGSAVDIATPKTVTIDAAGKKRNVTTTAQTVAGALTAAKIKVDGNDKLSVTPTAKLVDGTSVRYIRVTESDVTRKVARGVQDGAQGDQQARQGRHQGRRQGRQGRPHRHLQGGPARRQDREQEADQRQGDQEAGHPGAAGRHQGGPKPRSPSSGGGIDPVRVGGLGQRLGPAGSVRVGRQLVDQHRQRLLRRAAVLGQHLACVRRVGAARTRTAGRSRSPSRRSSRRRPAGVSGRPAAASWVFAEPARPFGGP